MSTPRILTTVYPDGRVEKRVLTPEEAKRLDEQAEQSFDFETCELKSTRAFREKCGASASSLKRPENR